MTTKPDTQSSSIAGAEPVAVKDSMSVPILTESVDCARSVDRKAVAELQRLSPSKWFLGAAIDWSAIVAAITLAGIINHVVVYMLAVLIVGTRQHALGILAHDGAHRLVTRHRAINDFLTGFLCFWPVGITVGGWRKFHWDHHRHVGTPQDPELLGKQHDAPEWDLPLTTITLLRRLVLDLCGFGIRDLLRMRKGTPKHPVRHPLDRHGPLIWFASFLMVTWLCGALWVFGIWVAAMVTSTWAMTRLRIWTEHVGTGGTHRFHANWWQRWFFLPHNTWYHYEHHEYPAVPFYNLPKARQLNSMPTVYSLAQVFEQYRTSHAIPSGKPLQQTTSAAS